MIPRTRFEQELEERLSAFAAVALLGPRQIGKTTIARAVADRTAGAVYIDLERPADRRRLDDADGYLRSQRSNLVVLDEVHRVPKLFEVLRGVIDDNRRAGHRMGQFLLVGSASLDLLRMSSESLAGRISHLELSGIAVDEAAEVGYEADTVWLRGGFPDSLSVADGASMQWREDLVRSYLERDVPMFAPRIPAETLRRLWTMLAHNSGGLLNSTRLAQGLGVSSPTVSSYVDLLVGLLLVRRLSPWATNTGKRLTKAPKIHLRDSGLLHSLLGIRTIDELLGHPAVGGSYESFVVETLIAATGSRMQPYHYRTARGDEVDLVLVRGGRPTVAIEVKRSTAPTVSAGFHRACDDLAVDDNRFVVHPDTAGDEYRSSDGATVIGLTAIVERLRRLGIVDDG